MILRSTAWGYWIRRFQKQGFRCIECRLSLNQQQLNAPLTEQLKVLESGSVHISFSECAQLN